MLFNSIEFIIFFPIVTLLFFLLPHRLRWVHLLLASCFFYVSFIPSYLLILFFLIAIDYSAGILIERGNNKKLWLIASVIANLSLLGVFKYFDFFITNINSLTGTDFILLNLILPIGLSFHTFQSLSYTIEVYKGRQKAITHLGYYSLFVLFYPQLVAGPIERPQHLIPQLLQRQSFSAQRLYEGLRLMSWGFFKKTVIADRVGPYADVIFNDPHAAQTSQVWLAVLFFSIQIYADFSGYSDIAIGAARCIGIDLSINFNRPYQATNIREFWKRWHISLSSWFRDYVYIPLGGNRHGALKKNIYLLLTFMLSALWHGAGWTFIVWGILHGVYTIAYDGIKKRFPDLKVGNVIGLLVTGLCVGFAWIFFRAISVDDAFTISQTALQLDRFSFSEILNVKNQKLQFGNFSLLLSLLIIAYMFFVERYTDPKLTSLNQVRFIDTVTFAGTLLLIIFFGVFQKSNFIYFQF